MPNNPTWFDFLDERLHGEFKEVLRRMRYDEHLTWHEMTFQLREQHHIILNPATVRRYVKKYIDSVAA